MKRSNGILLSGIAVGVLIVLAIPAKGDTAKTPHRIPKVSSAIRVDGVLDEPFWNEALVLGIDYEVTPGENIAPPVKTDVLLAYDDTRIFIAFKACDPEPTAIRARLADRDQLWADDWVGVFFDTFNDGRRDYGFVCNPLGIQCDMVETADGETRSEWDAIWDSAGRITNEGYIVEMAVPFSSLSFQRAGGEQVWGVDLVRDYPRSVRHHLGLFPRDRSNNCYMCQAEKLTGFAGAKPGKNLELDPTLSGVFTQMREGYTKGHFAERVRTLDPGLTARWSFTPSMNLTAAANPDFSQVEADAVQLDINTQFALDYPEKRPFFLEGADFFSTRLNILRTRTFADPNWGIKLSGKEGPSALGLFVVEDDLTNFIFPGSQGSEETSLAMKSVGSVLRYRRDVLRASTIGFMATDREGEDYHNRLGSFDGILRLTKKDAVRFQLLGSQTRYPKAVAADFGQTEGDFTGNAVDFHYVHDTRSFDWYTVYRQVSPALRSDLGFMPQVGYRAVEAGWGHTWNRDPGGLWTLLNVGSGYEYAEDRDGYLLEKGPSLWFNYGGPRQAYINMEAGTNVEGYNGREFDRWNIHADTGIWLTGDLAFDMCSQGGRWVDYENARSADAMRFSPSLEYRLGRRLLVGLGNTFERLAVDEGRLYTANATRLRLVYQFNRRTFIKAFVQNVDYMRNASLYTFPVTTRTKRLLSQLLFSYKINPQTVLFLGYSDNYRGGDNLDVTQTDRTFFAKIGYAWVM